MRLFNVTIETTVVVVAKDADDAVEKAFDAIRDLDQEAFFVIATEHTRMPHGWTSGCIPFGHRDPIDRDRTIGGWIKVLA